MGTQKGSSSDGPRAERARPTSGAAIRIVSEAVREGVSLTDLSKLALGDPAFALRVLSVVNSPVYAKSQVVTNVQQAASLLGIRGLRNVALGLLVIGFVPGGAEGQLLLAQSLRRAASCRLIAEVQGERDLDTYFTAGLLLESGLLVEAKQDPASVAKLAQLPSEYRIAVESASGLTPHPERGAAFAEECHLPPETVEAILHHHDVVPKDTQVARICWLSERVANVFESAAIDEARRVALSAGAKLGLSEAQIEQVLSQLPSLVAQSAAGFQAPVGEQLELDRLREDVHARLVQMNIQFGETIHSLERLIAEKEVLATQLLLANQELSRLAASDGLTGLMNRRALEESLTRDLARASREKKPLGLVMVDVDHFKRFNDTYGHQLGDEVLRTVGQVLRATARQGDVPARYGGEEFCVILAAADAEGSIIAAERLRKAIELATVPSARGPLRITASLGVAAISPGECLTKEALFERADQALYRAKEQGRNCVVFGPAGPRAA